MSFNLKLSTFALVSCFVIACGQGDKEGSSDQNAINTNTTLVPTDAALTTAATPTIYDIWVLDSINKKVPDSNFFSHGTPTLILTKRRKLLTGIQDVMV